MKVIKLKGVVINIGDWDYQLVPKLNEDDDPELDDDDNPIMIEMNPLPEGAIEEDAEVSTMADGGICLSTDYKKLRDYPDISEQLDYIYHHGIAAWKADMITPVKEANPKI